MDNMDRKDSDMEEKKTPADSEKETAPKDNSGDEMPSDFEAETDGAAESGSDEIKNLKDEMKFLNSRLKNSEDELKRYRNESDTLKDRLTRLNSEYENYRNRTQREKEALSDECTVSVLKEIMAPLDNLERALVAETDDLEGLKEGVSLTLEQFKNAFSKLGVEEIATEEGFDPELHEAVMHETDPSKDKNQVGEVFLKGYKKGNKVIRHSVVKVIN